MNFSITQAGVYASMIGLVLSFFKVNIGTEELTQFITAILTVGGLVTAWYGRYRKGDLTVLGSRI